VSESGSESGVSQVVTPMPANDDVPGFPTVTNLLYDPSAEDGSVPTWFSSTDANGTLGVSTTTGVRTGAQAMKYTAVTGDTETFASIILIGVVEGNDYTGSAYLTSSGTRSARLRIDWLETFSSVPISSSPGSSSALSSTPTRYSVTATAPATATRFLLVMETLTTHSNGELFYLDDGMLTEGATLETFFDGDTPDDGSYYYAWTSTPYQSPSTRTPV